MEELINLFKAYSQEEQQRILDKYKDAIQTIYKNNINQEYLLFILYCLEYSFNYLNNNFNTETKINKSWCMLAVMRYLQKGSITNTDEINIIILRTIDKFKSDEYNTYLNDIDLYNSEYSRDIDYFNTLII